jgi:hypothetical protein
MSSLRNVIIKEPPKVTSAVSPLAVTVSAPEKDCPSSVPTAVPVKM